MTVTLEKTMAEATKDRRVCPKPAQWSELWNLLREHIPGASARKPAAPLILAAWSETTDREKAARFGAHIRWAARGGCLDAAHKFIRSLPETAWHHFGE